MRSWETSSDSTRYTVRAIGLTSPWHHSTPSNLDRFRLQVILLVAAGLLSFDAHAHRAHEMCVVKLVDLVDGHVTRVTSRRGHVTTAERIDDRAQNGRARRQADLTNETTRWIVCQATSEVRTRFFLVWTERYRTYTDTWRSQHRTNVNLLQKETI